MANRIVIGPLSSPIATLQNKDVRKVEAALSSSIIGNELPIDEFRPTLYTEVNVYFHIGFAPYDKDGLETADGKRFCSKYTGSGWTPSAPYGTPVYWYSDGVLMGKFYAKSLHRTSITDYELVAVSAVGLLENRQHNGGIYTGQTFETVAADILGSITHSVTGSLREQRVYGWLPIASARENLHQLLFACGAIIQKDENGELLLMWPDTDATRNINVANIYDGGSVNYADEVDAVKITEHTYFQSSLTETEDIYDNSDSTEPADHYVVKFNGPYYNLATTGSLVINSQHVNYAVVTGVGTLTGKPYYHAQRVTTEGNANGLNVVSVDSATLVGTANGQNIAKRLFDYYSTSRSVNMDIVLNGELPGQMVNYTNPFLESEKGFIASLDMVASGILRGSCSVLTNYTPRNTGNNFTKVAVYTAAGSFTVPANCDLIRVVVIGGGQGGASGTKGGEAGGTTGTKTQTGGGSTWVFANIFVQPGVSGEPGQGGAAGNGGNVLVKTLNVTAGQSFSITVGTGGAGGVYSANGTVAGTNGTASTFGSYSSADGYRMTGGYNETFNNVVYAANGSSGVAGGYGNTDDEDSESVADMLDGSSVVSLAGATTITPAYDKTPKESSTIRTYYEHFTFVYKGGNGGAAVGSNGNVAPEATRYDTPAIGGAGADAGLPPEAYGYGYGGNGGNGGGAGGGDGGLERDTSWNQTKTEGSIADYTPRTVHAQGGAGSNGGAGGNGAVIVYYTE